MVISIDEYVALTEYLLNKDENSFNNPIASNTLEDEQEYYLSLLGFSKGPFAFVEKEVYCLN